MKLFITGLIIGMLSGVAYASARYGVIDGLQRAIELLEKIEINTRK